MARGPILILNVALGKAYVGLLALLPADCSVHRSLSSPERTASPERDKGANI